LVSNIRGNRFSKDLRAAKVRNAHSHAVTTCQPEAEREKAIKELQKAGHVKIDDAGMLTYVM
jgi:hypothetical protein